MRNLAINSLLHTVLFGLLLTVFCSMPMAAEQSAAGRAKAITPFIDEQTVAVVHLDITKIEIGPLFDEIAELLPEVKPQLAVAKAAAGAMISTVKQAGGTEVYLVLRIDTPLSDKNCLFAVVPLTEESNQETLTALLKQFITRNFTHAQRMDDVLVAGSEHTITRLKNLKPDPRPEIEKAFAATAGATARVLLLPPKHISRVIEEMMPVLPEQIGGGSSKGISDGFLWAAIGIDSPPNTALRGVIHSQDAQSAQALLDTWKRVYPRLFNDDKGRRGLFGQAGLPKADIDKLFELFTPTLDGDHLVLVFNKLGGGISKLVDTGRAVYIAGNLAAVRAGTVNICKQLGAAMLQYEADKGSLPVDSHDAEGRSLLSWRVHLLPYLGREWLYKKFHLDEPWDSPHNKKLIAQDPYFFRMQRSSDPKVGLTNFLVPVGADTVFPGKNSLRSKDLKKPSNTILIIEVDEKNAVPWTKPADLRFDPKNPAKGLGDRIPEGFTAVFCDGHVESISRETAAARLRKLFDRNR